MVVHGAGVDELPLDGTGVASRRRPATDRAVDRVDAGALGLATRADVGARRRHGRGERGDPRVDLRGRDGAATRRRAAQRRRGARRGRTSRRTSPRASPRRGTRSTPGMPRDLLARLRAERQRRRGRGGRGRPRDAHRLDATATEPRHDASPPERSAVASRAGRPRPAATAAASSARSPTAAWPTSGRSLDDLRCRRAPAAACAAAPRRARSRSASPSPAST